MNFGQCVAQALAEAAEKFGAVTPETQRERTRWVQQRVKELQRSSSLIVTGYAPKEFPKL